MKEKYYFYNGKVSSFDSYSDVNLSLLSEYKRELEDRPAKTDLPKHIAECGLIRFDFWLDFGSFRDIQRHRAITQRMPLLTTRLGFEEWYLNELPKSLREEAVSLIRNQGIELGRLASFCALTPAVEQYYIPMGYRTSNRITGGLPALVYLVELRATRFVHPTLRRRAVQMADTLMFLFWEYGLRLHLDPEPGRFDIERGKHDIVLK